MLLPYMFVRAKNYRNMFYFLQEHTDLQKVALAPSRDKLLAKQ